MKRAMKFFSGLFLLVLCLAVMCAAGCTTKPVTPERTAVTPVVTTGTLPSTPAASPAPSVPAITGTIVLPADSSPAALTTPAASAAVRPFADPTDLSTIAFSHYSDADFSVDYPSAWTITKATYTPYFCKNYLDYESGIFRVCYENETRSIGPFNFYQDNFLTNNRRIVTFTSADGTLRFVSFTADFVDGQNGIAILNPTIEWTRTQFKNNYPDLSASSYQFIGNYQFFKSGNTLTSSYDVSMYKGTRYYPSAFSKKSVITPHHLYTFAFITDIENFTKYQNLKEYMFSSITVSDAA